MSDVIPLFTVKIDGEEKRILPIIKDGKGRRAKSEQKVIGDLSIAIQEKARALLAGEEGGTTTVAAFILLETFTRIGIPEIVERIRKDPSLLQQAAVYCAIGMLAGRELPKGTIIETQLASCNPNLRESDDEEDFEENQSSGY